MTVPRGRRFGLDKVQSHSYSNSMRTALLFLVAAASVSNTASVGEHAISHPQSQAEPRLANLRQLTNGGENAEAYFSADGKQLIFQTTRPPEIPCDQIYSMNVDGSGLRRISSGSGRTTCAYFYPGRDRVLYASTHHKGPTCPPPPDMSRGYVWALYDYDIYSARPDGSDLRKLFGSPGYDA